MNTALDAATFQSQLGKYAVIYTPAHWPQWLIVATVLLLVMLAVLGLHGALRYRSARASQPSSGRPQYLYPLPVRLWHGSNGALFVLLLGSGLTTHFALLPAGATAWLVGFHIVCGFLLAIAWVCFIAINIATGNGRHYVVQVTGLAARMALQTKFYFCGILRGEPHPFHPNATSKFNPLQQITYVGVVYALMPLLLLTGLLSYCPEWLGALAGLRHWIFVLHQILAAAGLFFLCGHLYLCTTGRTPTETFRTMIDGYHR